MAKSNPLFVDSTKLHGDRIGTQVELCNVMIYDDEALLVVITDHQGGNHRVPLKVSDDRNYQGRVWLGHQKAIHYYFVVEKNGRMLWRSANFQGRAQYAIIEEWQPVVGEIDNLRPPEPSLSLEHEAQPVPVNYLTSVSSLIDKWGL
jgi:hypothetical protein